VLKCQESRLGLGKSGRRHFLKSGFSDIVLEFPLQIVLINSAGGWGPRRVGRWRPSTVASEGYLREL
jgi:hypothetical protein